MKTITNTAAKAINRAHQNYGEIVQLLKFMPSATGSIYRQSKRMYEAPFEIRASVSREPVEHLIGRTGEESERNAEITIPVSYLEELFGRST